MQNDMKTIGKKGPERLPQLAKIGSAVSYDVRDAIGSGGQGFGHKCSCQVYVALKTILGGGTTGAYTGFPSDVEGTIAQSGQT